MAKVTVAVKAKGKAAAKAAAKAAVKPKAAAAAVVKAKPKAAVKAAVIAKPSGTPEPTPTPTTQVPPTIQRVDKLAAAAEQENKRVKELATKVLAVAKSLAVKDDATLRAGGELLDSITTVKNQIAARRTFLLKPIKDHVRTVEAYFRDMEAPVKEADELVRGKLASYHAEQARARLASAGELSAEEQALRELLGDEYQGAALALTDTPKSFTTASGTRITASDAWDFEVVDRGKLDVGLLRAVVETKKGQEALDSVIRAQIKSGIRTIPGVRVYASPTISVVQPGATGATAVAAVAAAVNDAQTAEE